MQKNIAAKSSMQEIWEVLWLQWRSELPVEVFQSGETFALEVARDETSRKARQKEGASTAPNIQGLRVQPSTGYVEVCIRANESRAQHYSGNVASDDFFVQ
jgi:hypothetical protein